MRLTVEHVDGMRFLVTAGEHTLTVDAPVDEGGADTAMNSRQLFAASVAACALSFVVNSLRLRQWPLEHASLEMEYEEEQRPQRIARMDMRIQITPKVPEERRRALLGVAKHSIVGNTLARMPEIRITLEDAAADG